MDELMEIDPPEATWRGRVDEIRADLEPINRGMEPKMESHILRSHRNLSGLNKQNEEKFRTVLQILEEGQRA